MTVDPHAAEVQFAAGAFNSVMIGTPDGGSKPIGDIISHGQSFINSVKGLDGDDRAKGFFLNFAVVLLQPSDDGWFNVVAFVAYAVTACDNRGVSWQSS